MKDKVVDTFDQAVADIPNGASIFMECWGFAGTAQNLIAALRRHGARNLVVITHNFIPLPLGSEDEIIMPPVLLPQMARLISSVVGFQQLGAGAFVKDYVERGLDIELTTHGTLVSRICAAAMGLGGFYSPVGAGTFVAQEKESRTIDGKEYLFEKPMTADYGFIRAHKADRLGNLVYRGVHRTDQPLMAMAAGTTIAEVDEIVEAGELDPEHIITPSVFVDRIVKIPADGLGTDRRQRDLISRLGDIDLARKMVFRPTECAGASEPGFSSQGRLDRDTVAMRAARELREGDCVNLGIGIPNLCALYVTEGVLFMSENGVLGYGPLLMEDEVDRAVFHQVDAGGRFWRPAPGMAFMDLLPAFAMIRTGRLISILGALQVSENGDLANWNRGDDPLGGTIGGGMDLAAGAKRLIVTMEHTTREGKPKIVRELTCPPTGKSCVDLIVSDVAVIEVTAEGLVLKEFAPGWSADSVQSITEAHLSVSPELKEMEL